MQQNSLGSQRVHFSFWLSAFDYKQAIQKFTDILMNFIILEFWIFREIKYNMIISISFKLVKIMTWEYFMEVCKLEIIMSS